MKVAEIAPRRRWHRPGNIKASAMRGEAGDESYYKRFHSGHVGNCSVEEFPIRSNPMLWGDSIVLRSDQCGGRGAVKLGHQSNTGGWWRRLSQSALLKTQWE